MIQYRRIAAVVVGAWLGASAFADFAVTQNFQTVDRFLREPGSNQALSEVTKIGFERLRSVLRRNAGEENNFIFQNWENAELAMAAALIALMVAGGMRGIFMLSLAGGMLFIVAAQRVYLSPEVTELGRRIADMPTNDELTGRFWTMHNLYSGLEIMKLLLALGLGALFALPKRPDENSLEPEMEPTTGGKVRRA